MQTSTATSDNDVNFIKGNKQNKLPNSNVSYSSSSRGQQCSFCGNYGHNPARCRARSARCFKCNKRGHFSSVCKSSSNNCVEDKELSDEAIFNVTDNMDIGGLDNYKFIIGKDDVEMSMQKDTGSSCTLISDTMWRKIGCPKLAKSNGKALTSYDGHYM